MVTFCAGGSYVGKVLRSADSGDTWTEGQSIGETVWSIVGGYGAVWCLGINLNAGGKIYRSTDDGLTWALVYTEDIQHKYIRGISTDGVSKWCAVTSAETGYRAHILMSDDNGATWEVRKLATSTSRGLTSSATDRKSIWMAVGKYDFYRSNDEGVTWNVIYTMGDFTNAVATDGTGVWCVTGQDNNFYRSVNNGTSWSIVYTSASNPVALATDALDNWLAGGSDRTVWRSVDNGANWAAAYGPSTYGYVYSLATDELGHWILAIVTSTGGEVWLSHDVGTGWTPVDVETWSMLCVGAITTSRKAAPYIYVCDVAFESAGICGVLFEEWGIGNVRFS